MGFFILKLIFSFCFLKSCSYLILMSRFAIEFVLRFFFILSIIKCVSNSHYVQSIIFQPHWPFYSSNTSSTILFWSYWTLFLCLECLTPRFCTFNSFTFSSLLTYFRALFSASSCMQLWNLWGNLFLLNYLLS